MINTHILATGREKYFGKAKIMLGSHDNAYGLTKNGSPFSTLDTQLKGVFALDLEKHTFAAITMTHALDGTTYNGVPWLRTDKDITLQSVQKIKAGAWIGGDANDPTRVIGDDDGIYDEIVAGQRYRCLKQGATYYCDR